MRNVGRPKRYEVKKMACTRVRERAKARKRKSKRQFRGGKSEWID